MSNMALNLDNYTMIFKYPKDSFYFNILTVISM